VKSGNLEPASLAPGKKYFCHRCEHTRKQPSRRPVRTIDENFLYEDVVRKRRGVERPRLDPALPRTEFFSAGRSKE
jgi:hypothetical protein